MEIYKNDTIAAIATALSDSGIGIIRISGGDAIYIADSIFRSPSGKRILTKVQSHTVHYGYIVDKEENVIDEVMVVVMKAPKSYTTEDTVEINCHGGVLVVQKVLQTVLENGARMAEPGEFTKRAFLNGIIDLSRAEAVIDVIHSQNEYALSSSVSQLKGRLSDKIHKSLHLNLPVLSMLDGNYPQSNTPYIHFHLNRHTAHHNLLLCILSFHKMCSALLPSAPYNHNSIS